MAGFSVSMPSLSGIQSQANSGLKTQLDNIGKLEIDDAQKAMMKYQAQEQMRSLVATTMSNIMKSISDTMKGLAQNLR